MESSDKYLHSVCHACIMRLDMAPCQGKLLLNKMPERACWHVCQRQEVGTGGATRDARGARRGSWPPAACTSPLSWPLP